MSEIDEAVPYPKKQERRFQFSHFLIRFNKIKQFFYKELVSNYTFLKCHTVISFIPIGSSLIFIFGCCSHVSVKLTPLLIDPAVFKKMN